MNFCPECGAKNESNSQYCPLCGNTLEPNALPTAKDQKIQELEQKILQLEKKSDGQQKQMLPQNIPFWIIPVLIVAFFGIFALILYILLSR